MGEADRYSEFRQHTKRYRYLLGDDRNALVNLIIINIIFFLLLYSIKVGYQAFEKPDSKYLTSIFEYFALPAHLSVLSERPWTILPGCFLKPHSGLFCQYGLALVLWLSPAIHIR